MRHSWFASETIVKSIHKHSNHILMIFSGLLLAISFFTSALRPIILTTTSIYGSREPHLDLSTEITAGMAFIAIILSIRGILTAQTKDDKARWISLCIVGLIVFVYSLPLPHHLSGQTVSLHIPPYIILVCSIIASGIALYFIPKFQVKNLFISSDQRLELENKARATLLLAISGALVLITTCIICSGILTTNKIATNEQVTDRFIEAVEQLNYKGEGNFTKRLAATYSIQQMAMDSAIDKRPVVDVLAAFVRKQVAITGNITKPEYLATDIQVALTVIGSGEPSIRDWDDLFSDIYINLSETNLGGADLRGAYLRKVRLNHTYLSESNLSKANLKDAQLQGVDLSNANLHKANMESVHMNCRSSKEYIANLNGANLSGANLEYAEMEQASLIGANLSGAKMARADLFYANLSGADLRGADLRGTDMARANLRGADLRGAIGLTEYELNRAYTDNKTRVDPL